VLLVVSGRGLVVGDRATGREWLWARPGLVVGGRATGRKWSCYCFEVSRGHANA
jgi:hypothetical protein